MFDQFSLDISLKTSQKHLICFTVTKLLIVRVVLFTLLTVLIVIATAIIIKR